MTDTTTWPETVVARYLTVGGATVDITDTGEIDKRDGTERTVHAHCTGTSCTAAFERTGYRWDAGEPDRADEFAEALHQLQTDAQAHAETCRAMRRPA